MTISEVQFSKRNSCGPIAFLSFSIIHASVSKRCSEASVSFGHKSVKESTKSLVKGRDVHSEVLATDKSPAIKFKHGKIPGDFLN